MTKVSGTMKITEIDEEAILAALVGSPTLELSFANGEKHKVLAKSCEYTIEDGSTTMEFEI